ncbi:hypothetical protein [Nocardioides terrisoli]|uniref:hypothetical protein n=1 Tax=Nocardioides terrisoli TaxID=3388267 RepID=UPI00287B8BE2|nr:hypothetical protein [Nocardioides marmorisolisilvae]
MRTRFVVTLVGALTAAWIMAFGVVAPASAATATVSISTPSRIFLGDSVVAKGATSTSFKRKVILQRRSSTGWHNIDTGYTDSRRTYRLNDPVASRVGKYRIFLPAARHNGHRYTVIKSTTRRVGVYNQLAAGQRLTANRGIRSASGAYRLIQQGDGNLVVYKGSDAVWSARTNGAGRWSVMQRDGNFVVYAGPTTAATAVWSSSTQGAAGSRLVMQDDGNLVVYSAGGVAMWSAGTGHTGASQSSIQSNGAVNRLRSGQSLISRNGAYRAVMQGDGNFVVYNSSGQAQWSSGTAGSSGASLVNQNDGNLVVYSAAGVAKWSSSTAPGAKTVLVMQDDGNLVLYSQGGLALWSSKGGRTGYLQDTVPAGGRLTVGQRIVSRNDKYFVVMQGDGNLVKYTSTGTSQWSSATAGTGADRVVMQGDGNLVVYAGGTAKWSSATSGSDARLVIQDDGNLVVYVGATALWDAFSNGAPGGPAAGGIGSFKAWALDSAHWNSSTDAGNRGIDSDGWYGAQCADLGIAWSKQAGRPVGFDGWDTSTKSKPGWHYVSGNLSAARPGDVITRVKGIQHVVVVIGSPSAGSIQVLQQNPGSPAVATYSTTTSGVIWRLN